MKDKKKIAIIPKSFNITIGRLEIISKNGTASDAQVFFDGKLTDFIEEIVICLSGSEIAPKITMKVEVLNYARYTKEMSHARKN